MSHSMSRQVESDPVRPASDTAESERGVVPLSWPFDRAQGGLDAGTLGGPSRFDKVSNGLDDELGFVEQDPVTAPFCDQVAAAM